MTRIIIGGDICPTRNDVKLFTTGDTRALFGDILDDFAAADLVVANLETPLISSPSPIKKSGAVFGWPGECLNAIKDAGVDLLNLGNNHIMDHGVKGLESTLRVCIRAEIDYLGVGSNMDEAQKPYICNLNGLRVAVFSVAEHEFSIASDDAPGASPLDPIDFVKVFREYRSQFDFSVVLIHGGKEHYPYPTPGLQKICRFMIDEGANAVLCQHSHCPSGYENYRGGIVFYGQGNFIFNPYPDKRPWLYDGYLVSLDVDSAKQFCWEIIPFVQPGVCAGVRKLEGREKKKFLGLIEELSAPLADPRFVENKWRKYCADKKNLYLGILRGHGPLMRQLDSRFNLADMLYSRDDLLAVLNVVRCQSHRELLLEILEEELSR